MTKSRLMEILDKSRAETEVALGTLDPNKVIYERGGWRIKDIMGHLAMREQMAIFALQAYQEQKPYTAVEDQDVVNAQQVERRRNFTTDRIRQEWAESRERLKMVLLELPDELLEGSLTFPSGEVGPVSQLIQEIVAHEMQHRRDILRAVGDE